jgi:hypothetical protein
MKHLAEINKSNYNEEQRSVKEGGLVELGVC